MRKRQRLRSKVKNYHKYSQHIARDIGLGLAIASPEWKGEWILLEDGKLIRLRSHRKLKLIEEGLLIAFER